MGIPGVPANSSLQASQVQAPNDGAMALEMSKLGELLSSLENVIAQFTKNNEENHNDVANNYVKLAQEAHQKAVKAYNKYEQELSSQAHESFWQKLVGAIIAVVCCVAAVLTGQIEMVVLIVAFTVLQMTGGMKDIKDGLSKLLQEAGCSPEVANLLADGIIIAATILISHGAGGGIASMSDSAGLTLTKTAEETTSTVTEEVTEETTTAATEEGSESVLSQAKGIVNKLLGKFKNLASRLSRRTAFNLAAGSQAFITSGAGFDSAVGICSAMHDKKEKEKLEMTLMVILDLMASLAAGAGITRLGTEGRNMGETIASLANKGKVMSAASYTMKIGTAGDAAVSAAQGFTDASLADTVKELGKSKAIIDIVQALEQGADQEFSTIMRGETTTLNNLNKEIGSMGHDWSKLGAAISHCLELQA